MPPETLENTSILEPDVVGASAVVGDSPPQLEENFTDDNFIAACVEGHWKKDDIPYWFRMFRRFRDLYRRGEWTIAKLQEIERRQQKLERILAKLLVMPDHKEE